MAAHKENGSENGVLSYAVPLQLQCYMFIVGHLDELPSDVISLLPIGIRRKLLLMLPVLDLCKLEDTPVTDGISLDEEIWKAMVYNKCNTECNCCVCEYYAGLKDLTWREYFFHLCLYAIYSQPWQYCNLTNSNISECLIIDSEVTTTYYLRKSNYGYVVPERYVNYCSTRACNFWNLLQFLTDYNVSLQAVSSEGFQYLSSSINSEDHSIVLKKFLKSLIYIEVNQYFNTNKAEKVLNIVFTNPCRVEVFKFGCLLTVSPYITCSPFHKELKEIKIENDSLKNKSAALLRLIKYQERLEKLTIKNCQEINFDSNDLVFPPTLRELNIICNTISLKTFSAILRQFFSFSNPILLKIHSWSIYTSPKFSVNSIVPHPTQTLKELVLDCPSFPFKVLPLNIILKSASLHKGSIKSFSMLQSITVNEYMYLCVQRMQLEHVLNLLFITTAGNLTISVDIWPLKSSSP